MRVYTGETASDCGIDLSHHLSEETLRRKPNPMKAIGRLVKSKMISLASGDPHFSFYPLSEMQFTMASVDVEDPVASWRHSGADAPSKLVSISRISPGMSLHMGYTNATGIPEAQETIDQLVRHYHAPPNHLSLMTLGNSDSISKCFRLLANPGDHWLADEFTFTSSTNSGESCGIKWVPVRIDSGGIIPEELENILSTWDDSRGKRPRVIYSVPCGQNPTGSTLTVERRKQIYAIAQQYDIIIIEDDPYYFLRYASPGHHASEEQLIPSLLSMDVDGRVIRLDSFSKIIAPGMRLGWITCNPLFYEHFVSLTDSSTHHPHAFGQLLITQLLGEHGWGLAGFDKWVRSLRDDYQRRRDFLYDLYDKTLGETGYTSVSPPAAGMFLWIRVNLEKHPRYRSDMRETGDAAGPRTNVRQLMDELFQACLDDGVVVMPGFVFAIGSNTQYDPADDPIADRVNFLRITFAGTEDIMEQGMGILGNAVKDFFAKH